jgi:hypothetical protein
MCRIENSDFSAREHSLEESMMILYTARHVPAAILSIRLHRLGSAVEQMHVFE